MWGGGRRRPLGIVIGLAVTFTLTIVGLASVIDGVGLGNEVTRYVAIGVLAGVGLLMLVPAVAARVEAPLSRLARFGPKSGGRGFWSGIAVAAPAMKAKIVSRSMRKARIAPRAQD